MKQVEEIIFENHLMPAFLKGSDLFKLKLMRYIYSKDQYECFYLSNLQRKFKVSKGKISKIMNALEREKRIRKFKSYPVFWKRVV